MTDDQDRLISNRPPPAETARMELDEALAELDARREEILSAFTPNRLVVTDNATAGTTADKITLARAFLNRVDRLRRDHREQYDLAVRTVDGRCKDYLQEVRDAIRTARNLIETFRQGERDRAAAALEAQRAEEARLRAQAAAAEAPAAAVVEVEPVRAEEIQLPVARGDYGSKVSDQREKVYTIDDPRKLPDQILNAPAVRKAMLAAIKQLGRLQSTIAGVTISYEMGDKIRRAG